jgi:hypothetical protein
MPLPWQHQGTNLVADPGADNSGLGQQDIRTNIPTDAFAYQSSVSCSVIQDTGARRENARHFSSALGPNRGANNKTVSNTRTKLCAGFLCHVRGDVAATQ